MRRRSITVLLGCVALAVMAGQLHPTNEDSWSKSTVPAQVFFPTMPSTTTSVP